MSNSFEFFSEDSKAGFRLDYLQMYNWGTFHNHVVSLNLRGQNALITGPNGSGKSTLIDGITTLLYPAHRVRYNQASGGSKVERKIRDYYFGTYNTVHSEDETAVRDVSLRPDAKHLSILLARFYNEGINQTVTLCQILYTRDKVSSIERLYIISRHPISIEEHFTDIPDKIADLKKYIGRIPGTELHPSFSAYSKSFQRLFSMKSDQPLELFHKTISMKQVDNYTDFIRSLMLEPNDPSDQLNTLTSHFDSLTDVHNRMVELGKQRDDLDAMFADVGSWEKLSEDLARYQRNEDIIPPYGKFLRHDFAVSEQKRLSSQLASAEQLLEKLQDEIRGYKEHLESVTAAIAQNGGQRLNELKLEIDDLSDRLNRRKAHADNYRKFIRQLALPFPDDERGFTENIDKIRERSDSCEERRADILEGMAENRSELKDFEKEMQQLSSEIESLRTRENNLDMKSLSLRQRMGDELDIAREELPFVAELISVKEDQRLWEGAIERLLNSFGKTLLFPDYRKAEIENWINSNHLRTLLIAEPVNLNGEYGGGSRGIQRDSVYHKLSFHPINPYASWTEEAVIKRFNYSACDTIEAFHSAEYALTPEGLIKRAGRQLRKDDRNHIGDQSRYILGWDTRNKIRALDARRTELDEDIAECRERLERQHADDRNLSEVIKVCQILLQVENFSAIDIRTLSKQYQDRIDERDALENSSDVLQSLQGKRTELVRKIDESEAVISRANRNIGDLSGRLDETNAILEALAAELDTFRQHRNEIVAAGDALGKESKTRRDGKSMNEILNQIDEMFQWNKNKMQKANDRVRDIEQKLVGTMSNLGGKLYPADMRDFGNSIDSIDEYRQYYQQLIRDDLPQFSSKFKRMLNQETVQGIVQFRQHLEYIREQMERGIGEVNRSMKEINFSEGRYLELIAQATPDVVIKEFKSELRACTEDSLSAESEDVFSEDRFLKVKALIERFQADPRWTQKVTDVRNWMIFQISEKRRGDGMEVARYSDSNRKSGGEKEKLAYTILAASLAYQFGLQLGETRSDSFRFVMIDEAFHKASSDSTQYGMELFKLFNLQLLLVTPNKDIPIIEQYVSTVGLTHKTEASHSMLYTTDIDTFMEERLKASGKTPGKADT